MAAFDVFKAFLDENYPRLDAKIDIFNKALLAEAPEGLMRSMSYFTQLNSGGKMLRGVLADMGYYIMHGENDIDYADTLALSLEIFQSSILIHDDLLDHGNTRRGKETAHTRIFKEFNISNATILEESPDIMKDFVSGISVALGYVGLYTAYEKLLSAYDNNPNILRLLRQYNDMVIKTVEGGIMDVVVPFSERYKDQIPVQSPIPSDPFVVIENLATLKTAYYTTMGPLVLGMILAGATDEQVGYVSDVMIDAGLAFQIQDDLLGIYADWDDLGKDVGADVAEYKQTFLYAYVKANDEEALTELNKYYGDASIDIDGVKAVQEIFNRTGAYKFAHDKMEFHYSRAKERLSKIDFLDEEGKDLILGFIEYLEQRKK
ncbi:MAG: polyprenyl synthetase family protein [Clostridia bacterium]|nr:polyprenyl synthetase family protein [Clostridia bacterium]MBR5991776.1 polyprenyl synthetase family protein [Clostridia bacterium]